MSGEDYNGEGRPQLHKELSTALAAIERARDFISQYKDKDTFARIADDKLKSAYSTLSAWRDDAPLCSASTYGTPDYDPLFAKTGGARRTCQNCRKSEAVKGRNYCAGCMVSLNLRR